MYRVVLTFGASPNMSLYSFAFTTVTQRSISIERPCTFRTDSGTKPRIARSLAKFRRASDQCSANLASDLRSTTEEIGSQLMHCVYVRCSGSHNQ